MYIVEPPYCRRPPGGVPPRPGVPEPRGHPQLQRGQQPRQQGGVVQAGQGLAELYTVHHGHCDHVTLELEQRSIRRFAITEKAPTRAFFCLKAPTSTLLAHLRHY